MRTRNLLNTKAVELTINRLCFELIENHKNFLDTILIGLQPRGVLLAKRIEKQLKLINPKLDLKSGSLDITFYRDDFRRGDSPIAANSIDMPHLIENKKVVLIDDVLYTGRSIRSALDALVDFGRPECVELLVLVDRRFSRHLPIQPNYVGRKVDAIDSERVEVKWQELNGKDSVDLQLKTKNNE